MGLINDIITEVYEEAISLRYVETEKRLDAMKNVLPFISEGIVFDLCPNTKEFTRLREDIIPMESHGDMHEYLEAGEDWVADMIIVRHVLEHSIMPYVLLKLLRRHTKKLLVIVPEDNKRMIEYPNHYSVMSKLGYENLFKKSGWKFFYKMTQVFNANGYKEHVYVLEKL